MIGPHAIASQFSQFIWVLTDTPQRLQSTRVIHKWFEAFAGWGSEPANEDQLEIQLGLVPQEDAAGAPVLKTRIVHEVAEVRKYMDVMKQIPLVSPDTLEYVFIVKLFCVWLHWVMCRLSCAFQCWFV
jgi:hypothetical protein